MHYSYIQEHITPSTSFCIKKNLYVSNVSSLSINHAKKKLPWVNPQPLLHFPPPPSSCQVVYTPLMQNWEWSMPLNTEISIKECLSPNKGTVERGWGEGPSSFYKVAVRLRKSVCCLSFIGVIFTTCNMQKRNMPKFALSMIKK